MTSNATEKAGPGEIHAQIVDDAEKTVRQFNTAALSAYLQSKLANDEFDSTTAAVEWSTYHQMVSVHRLQMETLFDAIYVLDEGSCGGWQVDATNWGNRLELLKSIQLSIASLMFARTSTTVTMGTVGASNFAPYNFAPYLRTEHLAEHLVKNEGIASLKADFELTDNHATQMLKLITKLTESPSQSLKKPWYAPDNEDLRAFRLVGRIKEEYVRKMDGITVGKGSNGEQIRAEDKNAFPLAPLPCETTSVA